MMSAKFSLPPKVTGRLYGHLVMKIDEVVWARKPPGEVTAVVMWWGGDSATTFRPSDVSQRGLPQEQNSVIYEIHTSRDLFENYLEKCGSMKVAIADKYGMPIGCAKVVDLSHMIHCSPYQGYYPIVNNFGNRIGDIHVSFDLKMSPQVSSVDKCTQSSENRVTKTKVPESSKKKAACTAPKQNTKALSSDSSKRPVKNNTKEEKMRRNQQVSDTVKDKCNSGHAHNVSTFEGKGDSAFITQCGGANPNINAEANKYVQSISSSETARKTALPVDNIITQILESGRRLRDAMTISVLEDGVPLDLGNLCGSGKSDALKQSEMEHNLVSHLPSETQLRLNCCTPVNVGTAKLPHHAVEEKKVIDYLSGKPLTAMEEKEALETLRSMTPTQDLMEKVISVGDDKCKDREVEVTGKLYKEGIEENKPNLGNEFTQNSKEEVLTSVTGVGDARRPIIGKKDKHDFDIDLDLLSKVNTIRITVHSVILNAVGLKRIGMASPRQQSLSKGGSSVHPPPGVTYFVEYQSPQSGCSDAKPWTKDVVRYCSKRQIGQEIAFGDRTTHILPANDLGSQIHESTLASYILSLTFKVCARHLNQRVPVSLGSAAPDSAALLFASAHLRHDYDLPVISSDNLPVAQLRVCLELGRDRIHFGGLFDLGDPSKQKMSKDNYLCAATPSGSAHQLIKKTKTWSVTSPTPLGMKNTNRAATVTRNVSQKLTSANTLWQNQQAAQRAARADTCVERLVTDAQIKARNGASWQSPISQSSRGEESGNTTPAMKLTKERLAQKYVSSYNLKPKDPLGQVSTLIKPLRYLKHDLALTIEQIKGCAPLSGPACQDRDCFVSYKFPFWDASKDSSVEWRSFSTEPTVSLQDTWFRKQSRIHTVVLEESISLHTFLLHTFKQHNSLSNPEVTFSICERQYGAKVEDFLTAQAFLPITTIDTLEETFSGAAANDPNFNESSCASVVLDLPLQLSPSYSHIGVIGSGQLRVKVDYRHWPVEESEAASSHSSQEDKDKVKTAGKDRKGEAPWLNLAQNSVSSTKRNKEAEMHACVQDRTTPIPNWARSPERRITPRLNSTIFSCYNAQKALGKTTLRSEVDATSKQLSSGKHQNLHASWQPVMNFEMVGDRVPQYHLDYSPLYQNLPSSLYSSRVRGSPYKSMVDLHSADLNPTDGDLLFKDRDPLFRELSPQTLRKTSASVSCEDLYSHRYDEFLSHRRRDINVENNDTMFDVRRRDMSPLVSCQPEPCDSDKSAKDRVRLVESETKSATTEKASTCLNQAEQTASASVSVGSQTTHTSETNMNCQTTSKTNANSQTAVGETAEIDLIDLTADDQKDDDNLIVNPGKELRSSDDDVCVQELTIAEKPNVIPQEVVLPTSPNRLVQNSDTSELDVEKNVVSVEKQNESVQMLEKDKGLERKNPVFRAKVGVECALHLCTSLPQDILGELDSTFHTYVTFHPSQVTTEVQASPQSESKLHTTPATPAVPNHGEPLWHWHCDTALPIGLLFSGARLVFQVWQQEGKVSKNCDKQAEADHLIGFAAVDLTVLAAGLPVVSGWFNVMDFGGVCRGQIKLSIEPLEDLQKWKNTVLYIQSQTVSGSTEKSSSPHSSMYIAHSVHPEFPSHVVQYPDIHVQKIDTLSQDEALTAVLSGYQVLLQQCQKLSRELPIITSISSTGTSLSPCVSLQRKEKKFIFETPATADCRDTVRNPSPTSVMSTSSTALEPVSSLQESEVCIQNSTESRPDDETVDHSACLREKLSELDALTRMMKERLILPSAQTKHLAYGSQSCVSPVVTNNGGQTSNGTVHPGTCAGDGGVQTSRNSIKNDASIKGVEECKNQKPAKSGESVMNFAGHSSSSEDSCTYISVSQGSEALSGITYTVRSDRDHVEQKCKHSNSHREGNQDTDTKRESEHVSSQKSRKMWEKCDEALDLNIILNSPMQQNSNSFQLDDVAEWLSDSAMQHVFNPVLFHDLLLGMQEERPSSQVLQLIELEDDASQLTRSSSLENIKNPASSSVSCEPPVYNRGDEIYREETSGAPSRRQTVENDRGGTSAGDTDSGVDVNLPGSLAMSSQPQPASSYHPSWVTNESGGMELSAARQMSEGSSSSSAQSPSIQDSSLASFSVSTSVSATLTPTDSPQRRRQAPEGGNPIEHVVGS